MAPEAGDAVVPLTDFVELSFSSPLSPSSVPDHPQDLCTPQLRQLLSPIFNRITASPSPASSPDPLQQPSLREDELMDTSKVEQFFAVCPEEAQREEGETVEDTEGMDLDMLAPYISMDDDFQLTVLSNLPEEANKLPSSSSESNAVTPAVTVSRKRIHNPDEEMPSQLMMQDKRLKQDPSSIEEELLLSHRLLGCLEETDQSDLLLEPSAGGRSQLLTDRDPVLGGIPGLCDTAALIRDIFLPRPPDLSPLSAMT